MATKIGIGFSSLLNSQQAAQDAALVSKKNLNQDQAHLAFVFCTPRYNPNTFLPILQKSLKDIPMIGCSTPQLILPNAIEPQGILVITFAFDQFNLATGIIHNLDRMDPLKAGNAFAQECLSKLGEHRRQIFSYFIDSRYRQNTPFLNGIQQVIGNIFPIIGFAGANDTFSKDSLQFYNYTLNEHSAAGLLLGGNLSIGLGGAHGWRPLGKPRLINEAEGNIIGSIDGKKPISLYREFFEEKAAALFSEQHKKMSFLYPLGLPLTQETEYLLRTATEVLPDGRIACQGDCPADTEVHIMICKKDTCLDAAVKAAREAKENLAGKQANLILVFESLSRLKLLGRGAFQEIQKINEVFAYSAPVIGIYTHGEAWPFQPIKRSTLERTKKTHWQNNSIVIMAIN